MFTVLFYFRKVFGVLCVTMPVIQTVATMQMIPAQPINRIRYHLAVTTTIITPIIIAAATLKRAAAVAEGAAAARAARKRSECRSWTLVCWALPSMLPQTGSMLDLLIQSPLWTNEEELGPHLFLLHPHLSCTHTQTQPASLISLQLDLLVQWSLS